MIKEVTYERDREEEYTMWAFRKKIKGNRQTQGTGQPQAPDNRYSKCGSCQSIVFDDDLQQHTYCCPHCGAYFQVPAQQRIEYIVDKGSFRPKFQNLKTKNPLQFVGYEDKYHALQQKTGLNDAVLCGSARVHGKKIMIAVFDTRFLMGSLSPVVGEMLTRTIEYATKKERSLVIVSASGGARMQEGMMSLLQMAKTSNALKKHHEKGLFYLSVLTHPTTGGVTASFAMLGDIQIAEQGALIGFAGPRVIEQTIGASLPEGFQRAEFQMEKGFVDAVYARDELHEKIRCFLLYHEGGVCE